MSINANKIQAATKQNNKLYKLISLLLGGTG